MTGKKLGRLLVVVLTMLLAVGFFGGAKHATVVADAATVPGKGTPTADPSSFLFWYTNTGFRLQPQDQYTTKGKSKTLTSAVGYSFMDTFFNPFAFNHFQWYQSTDAGAHWTAVKNATNSSLTVTPTQAGTVYYQESFGYYLFIPPIFSSDYYYSRVAAVTTLGDPVNATGLSVKADSNYLYNNQGSAETKAEGSTGNVQAATTNVRATPTPADATGNISWTSSDSNLATVDRTSGVVTANTEGKSGTVTITGTIANPDGTTKSASTEIRLGGGLDDQTVDSGKSATFTVQGSFASTPQSVTWYKKAAGSTTATKVSSGTSLSYTTPTTTAADDQSEYYAKVTIASDGNTHTITTNSAKLSVNFSYTPKVTVTSTIKNLTDSTGDTPTLLNNVIYGDNCEISGTIVDSNPDSKMKTMDLKILMPVDVEGTTFTVDGKAPGNFQYATAAGPDSSSVYVEFKNVAINPNETHRFDLKFTSISVANGTYRTVPEVIGYDASGNKLGTYTGNDNLTINTSDNALTTKAAGNVTFGSLSYANINQEIEGQVVGGGSLLDVTDNRRVKKGTTVTLQQMTPFENGDDSHTLNATLSYASGSLVKPLTNAGAQTIIYSGTGIALGSLNASHGDKLQLNIPSQAIYPGSYSSTLQWTITQAPS